MSLHPASTRCQSHTTGSISSAIPTYGPTHAVPQLTPVATTSRSRTSSRATSTRRFRAWTRCATVSACAPTAASSCAARSHCTPRPDSACSAVMTRVSRAPGQLSAFFILGVAEKSGSHGGNLCQHLKYIVVMD